MDWEIKCVFVSGPTEADKPVIIELAATAMEELIRMAHDGEPLWMPSAENSEELLSEDEYLRNFRRSIGPRPLGLVSEASRERVVVNMNHVNLVPILMDVNQWAALFCGIVSRAVTMEVLSTGVAGSYNGALQVMVAEFQTPSPLVPTREIYFLRYCKQHEDGCWAVVDVSLDSLHPGPISRSRRRPSGCLIQEMPSGYSKVTWVEHVEIDDSGVHNIYKQLVKSNLAFGAKRWVATLNRHCECLASAIACNDSAGHRGGIFSPGERRSMLKLTERMAMNFYSGLGASTANTWTALSGTNGEDVWVMARKSVDDPGRPPGIVLSAATSFWLPIPPKKLFNFLRDEKFRSKWDILSYDGSVQEMAHIANDQDPGSGVSLLIINSADLCESNMLIVQESCSDPTGSYVIYAPVDVVCMDIVLFGGDPDGVAILPSGFAILPDGPAVVNEGGQILDVGSGGSLLTVAFQILVASAPTAKVSPAMVEDVNNFVKLTVERIKAAVSCNNNA